MKPHDLPDSWPPEPDDSDDGAPIVFQGITPDQARRLTATLYRRTLAGQVLGAIAVERFHSWRKECRMGRREEAERMAAEAVEFARSIAEEAARQEFPE